MQPWWLLILHNVYYAYKFASSDVYFTHYALLGPKYLTCSLIHCLLHKDAHMFAKNESI